MRFIIIYLILAGVILGVVSVIVFSMVENYVVSERINQEMTEINTLSVRITPYVETSDAQSLYSLLYEAGKELGGRFLVLNNSGIVQADSFSSLNATRIATREVGDVLTGQKSLAYGFHKIADADTGKDRWSVYYTVKIRSGGEDLGAVLYSSSIQDIVESLNKLQGQILLVYMLSLAAIILSSLFATNIIVKPIRSLTETAAKISRGDLSQRSEIQGQGEIAEFGKTFNMMCDRIQDVDIQRSEFVANASHELKTPLTSMKILVESLLYEQNVDEKYYKEFLGDINNELDRMSNLVNDLLLLTKMDSDLARVNITDVSLTALIEECMDALLPIAHKQGVTISFDKEYDVTVQGDRIKLHQAVFNIMGNAVKYSKEHGSVQISLSKIGDEAHICVRDDGVGIPKDQLSHIFERFYRVDKARSRETGGSGLGLHIVQRIALLHHGRVDVQSTEGVGSAFTLILPLYYQQTPEKEN